MIETVTPYEAAIAYKNPTAGVIKPTEREPWYTAEKERKVGYQHCGSHNNASVGTNGWNQDKNCRRGVLHDQNGCASVGTINHAIYLSAPDSVCPVESGLCVEQRSNVSRLWHSNINISAIVLSSTLVVGKPNDDTEYLSSRRPFESCPNQIQKNRMMPWQRKV